MKIGVIGIGCALLLAPASALAQPDQLAHDMAMKREAVKARDLATKAGDKAAIARADARLRTADEDIFADKNEASWTVPANAAH